MHDLPTTYDQSKEPDIYKIWELSGYFNPDNLTGEPYTIIMPPPNATGTLHIGHAFEHAIQDTIIRYKRMAGYKTLWLPGTDHAAIASNTKVEKILIKEEGKNRHDIGREAFVKKVEDFVEQSRGTMQKQLRVVGDSADWTRESFTMDEKPSKAVKKAFQELFNVGLAYQDDRVVNWDAKGQTTVSDDEIVHEKSKGHLYTFKYDKSFPFAISTTLPETKLGDTAVAVHPDDKRYKQYVGQIFEVNFAGVNLSIKVVADKAVDPEFGTGAVGITPSHSKIDEEIALRHGLQRKQVFNEYIKILDHEEFGEFAGKKLPEAREKILEWLNREELLKTEEIEINIPKADRSGGTVYFLPKRHQWFIAVNKPFVIPSSKIEGIKNGSTVTLKQLMKHVVESGQIKILPERFKKIYFHWIDNLRDWNISRQLWYGHRIPIWYCSEPAESTKHTEICDKPVFSIGTPEKCPGCGSKLIQDTDTLDTWFSSALWTFSTLGWPEQTEDLKTFHPTDFMAPGYEILFFWVARMILMSTFLLGEIPFKTVYLHGIVRDITGKKFSKSLDNGIDPVDVIGKYGADALRMALVVGIGPGNDSKYSEQKVKGYRNFANKIWNAARFVYQNVPHTPVGVSLSKEDQTIIDELNAQASEITKQIEEYDFAHASENLYHYFWHTFADKIIEESKAKLADDATKASTQAMLVMMLETLLKLLHPFMPFVTETVWQLKHKELLMIQSWPSKRL
jgi:valyl-tRNA synthetase